MLRSASITMTVLSLGVLGALSACTDSPSDPTPDTVLVAGAYSAEGPLGAVVFTTRENGAEEETDQLAEGGSILLALAPGGSTTGHLFVPGADEDGGDMDEDLTGTWTLSNGVVEFQHEADTFLRDMSFTWTDGRLEGEETFGSMTIRVEMIRR